MSVWDELKTDAKALALLKDWLGDGLTHVTREKADHRALACLRGNEGNPCPHNIEPNWWNRVRHVIASVIKNQLFLKDKLGMTTTFEKELGMCGICKCCLALKVNVPIEHIRKHTTPETSAAFPEYCWQACELKGLP
jgi:hypothetical protein